MKKTLEPAPYLIIGAFVGFAIFILYMVFMAFGSEVNMVRKDYYEQELRYGEQQIKISQANALGESLKLDFNSQDRSISFFVPQDFDASKVVGKFWFYRPSDSRLDFELALESRNINQSFSVAHLQKGKWIVKLNFEYEGKSFFKEKAFIIE